MYMCVGGSGLLPICSARFPSKRRGSSKEDILHFPLRFPSRFGVSLRRSRRAIAPGTRKTIPCVRMRNSPSQSRLQSSATQSKGKRRIRYLLGNFVAGIGLWNLPHIQGNIWKAIGEFHTRSIERGVIEERASSSIQL